MTAEYTFSFVRFMHFFYLFNSWIALLALSAFFMFDAYKSIYIGEYTFAAMNIYFAISLFAILAIGL